MKEEAVRHDEQAEQEEEFEQGADIAPGPPVLHQIDDLGGEVFHGRRGQE